MLEKEIERRVCLYARRHKFEALKQEWVNTHGAPDRMFITPTGKIFMIEFKSARGTLSSHQERRIASLRARNVDVYVINSVEAGERLIDLYVNAE